MNPNFPPSIHQLHDIREAARTIGLGVHDLRASTDQEIESAFEAVTRHRIRALVVSADPSFNSRRRKLAALAEQHAVPTIYQFREYVVAGGLMNLRIVRSFQSPIRRHQITLSS